MIKSGILSKNLESEIIKKQSIVSEKKEMVSLAKDTAIYGVSSIVGRFLNWLLVPMYTFVLQQSADYGIVTNLYAWTALLLVILTYGMETGFFRFINKQDEQPNVVYTTTMTCIGFTSVLFVVLIALFRHPIATGLGYAAHSDYILYMAITVACDAFACIPFAYLRYKKRPVRFALLKLLFVVLNIAFNLFFLVVCPRLLKQGVDISGFYNPDYGVGYVFLANLLATALQTAFLLPEIFAEKYHFSWKLLKQMLRYSLPLLVLGIAGIMNQTIDRIIYPFLNPMILSTDPDATIQSELGVYGACFKIAMVMMMFTQAFRYAYEPYVFSKHKDRQSVEAYADAMKYYIIFSYLIMIAMIVYLDLLKLLIAPSYWEGMRIVPIVLWTYLFQGVYFNLSFWYKLQDKTVWGAYFSLIGLVITVMLQVWLVPKIGYMASALSSMICYLCIMLLSFFIGQKNLPIPYDLKRIGLYTLLAVAVMFLVAVIKNYLPSLILQMFLGTLLLLAFAFVVIHFDFPLSGLPVVGKYFAKRK